MTWARGENGIEERELPLNQLKSGDIILLCSDGISGVLTEDKIAKVLELPPQEACLELHHSIEEAAKPNQDNYTGIIIACENGSDAFI
jgi:serine/threonine protein phosphatase PrpC